MVDIHSSRKDFIKFKIDILKASISSLEFQGGTTDLKMEIAKLNIELDYILEIEDLRSKINSTQKCMEELKNKSESERTTNLKE